MSLSSRIGRLEEIASPSPQVLPGDKAAMRAVLAQGIRVYDLDATVDDLWDTLMRMAGQVAMARRPVDGLVAAFAAQQERLGLADRSQLMGPYGSVAVRLFDACGQFDGGYTCALLGHAIAEHVIREYGHEPFLPQGSFADQLRCVACEPAEGDPPALPATLHGNCSSCGTWATFTMRSDR